MKPKKTTPSPKPKRAGRNKSPWIRWTIIALLAITGILLLWFVLRFNEFDYGKREVLRPEFQTIINRVKLPGEAAYSAITDQGCDSGSSVGLSTRINCNLAGYKLYRSKTASKVDLRAANRYLIDTGWERYPFKGAGEEGLIATLDSEATNNPDVAYERDGLVIHISPISYARGSPGAVSEFANLVAPTDKEHVIGIYIQSTYWHCSENIIFLPCPPAPSRPQ